jgi:LEA14-like dessication related protein
MKILTKSLAIFSLLFVITICGCLADEILRTYNMQKCEYSYKSVSNVSIGGIKVSNGISLLDMPKVLLLLNNSKSIPLAFTLTLDVKNPSQTEAAFRGIQYKIAIDGIDFNEGAVDEPFSVGAGETKPLSIKIESDAAKLIESKSRDAVINMIKNFIGIGNEKSHVQVQLKPNFLVGSKVVTSPVAFPVEFSFGGK